MTPRPSFTIESLLSRKDEQKLDIEQCKVASLTAASPSSVGPGQFTNVGTGSELIQDHSSRSYLSASPFRCPPSFCLEQASLFGRGNVQASGELI